MKLTDLFQRKTTLHKLVEQGLKNGLTVLQIQKKSHNPRTKKPYARNSIYYHKRIIEGGE